MHKSTDNVSLTEINKFDALAKDWWDPEGEMKPLHLMNPIRLHYIEKYCELGNKKILDVGCGGGILSEALAKKNAEVTAIDLSTNVIDIAKKHAEINNIIINYQVTLIEDLCQTHSHFFDVITVMELLEHVPDPQKLIHCCQLLLKPNGAIFFSTINRNFKSYLFAILGAEYILKLLPKKTHDYAQFIRPSELNQWALKENLTLKNLSGISYRPLSQEFYLSQDLSINYLAYFTYEY